ncbi:MAG: J domain-containing protein [Magnetococcales bacterium]|nr:J domain-containing protein [Magnetococcales bacterium]
MNSDPYFVLGLSDDADDEAVRQAYLRGVRTFSPDRHPERFQEIRAAYEALQDPRRRAAWRLFHPPRVDFAALLAPLLRPDPAIPRPTSRELLALLAAPPAERGGP